MSYTNKDIKTLDFLTGVRTKLSLYAGSKCNQACLHGVKEIINNSVDEYLAGSGNKIEIFLDTSANTIQVRDYARGLPFESMENIFTKGHTSGKFSKDDGDSPYQTSSGLFGIGNKILTATGKVEAWSFRGGKQAHQSFHYLQKTDLVITPTKEANGTLIKWTPDDGVFDDNVLYSEKIVDLIKTLSYVIPNLEFVLTIDKLPPQVFKCKDFYNDFLDAEVPKDKRLSPVIPFKFISNDLVIEGSLLWNKGFQAQQSYVNLTNVSEGGNHLTAFRATLTREINKMLNSDLSGEELRSNLSFIISVKMKVDPVFSSQQKVKLNMPSINPELNQGFKQALEGQLIGNKNFFADLLKQVEQSRKREAALLSARELFKPQKSEKLKKQISEKLKPCLLKKGGELYVVEGASAGGTILSSRDPNTQALLALRGKVINVSKAELDKVLKNEEIRTLISILGDFQGEYSVAKCPYDKIILALDADSDGGHICVLLINFFYNFYPALLREGKIYMVETPLYIFKNNTESFYAFTETEKNDLVKKGKVNSKTVISRVKGLGELDADTMKVFGVDKKTRRLHQLTMDNIEETGDLLTLYLGADGEGRRELV